MTTHAVVTNPGSSTGASRLAVAAFAAISIAAGILCSTESPSVAFAAVALPTTLFLAVAHRYRAFAFVVPIMALTTLFGRDFAHLGVGPLYALDIALVVLAALALPEILAQARGAPGVSLVLLGLIALALAKVVLAGASAEALRHSVLGIYALWAFVGFAIVRLNLVSSVAKAIIWGGAVTAVPYALVVFYPANVFTSNVTPRYIGAAGSLYAAYFLLGLLFAPQLAPRRKPVLLCLVAIAILDIAAGEVRSVWVAIPIALAVAVGVTRVDARLIGRLGTLGVALIAGLAIASVAAPTRVDALATEATSIYNHGGATASDANARWRVTAAQDAISRIENHPAFGVSLDAPSAYHTNSDGTISTADIHNSFIDLVLRLGLVGGVCVLVFQLAVIQSARRIARRAASDTSAALATWLLSCQLLTGVHALFTVVLEGPYMGLFYWMLGGVLIAMACVRNGRDVQA
ncbi:hypothetical protein AYO48_04030 [Gaiella sp. SCGC AG-212-M14]|nr:hypothetical protein AYO48_04030 [Gaiella sp. SCGC AG-212-M14]